MLMTLQQTTVPVEIIRVVIGRYPKLFNLYYSLLDPGKRVRQPIRKKLTESFFASYLYSCPKINCDLLHANETSLLQAIKFTVYVNGFNIKYNGDYSGQII